MSKSDDSSMGMSYDSTGKSQDLANREMYDETSWATDVAKATGKVALKTTVLTTKVALKTTVFTTKTLGKLAMRTLGVGGAGGKYDGSNEQQIRERSVKAGWIVHNWENPLAEYNPDDPDACEGEPLTLHQPRLIACTFDGLHMMKGDKGDEDGETVEMLWLDLHVRHLILTSLMICAYIPVLQQTNLGVALCLAGSERQRSTAGSR